MVELLLDNGVAYELFPSITGHAEEGVIHINNPSIFETRDSDRVWAGMESLGKSFFQRA